MKDNIFERVRKNGLSNQQVIVEHVRDSQPGTIFTYDDLARVLAADSARTFTRHDVQSIVRLATVQLLRNHQRTLDNVRNVGYKLAHAKEHLGIADRHTKRGQRQMRRALSTLENVRLDEMSVAERELHTAQCVINSTLYAEQQRLLSKQNRHSQLIASLVARVDQLEAKKES